MPATAAARRVAASPARRATANRPALKPRPRRAQPARRTAPRRRRAPTTPVVGFVPVAVGRTADAVGGLADSGLVVRLTRGRLWIGALGVLLVGIVALNVGALSISASSSKVGRDADALRRANSTLKARLAGELSNERVQIAAGEMGLAYPTAEAIRYLRPKPNAAVVSARRIAEGEISGGAVAAPATAIDPMAAEAPVAPAPPAPVE